MMGEGGGVEKEEEEASKCYFRESFCPFVSVYVRFCPLSEEEDADGETED